MMQIVYFKRDLRLHDHAPLAAAAARGPVLPLYIVEPSVVRARDFDPAHWTFLRASLHDLRERLATLGQPLVVRVGEAVPVFEALARAHTIGAIWAHEETGNNITYLRDRALRRWARSRSITFHELPNNGVVRRLPSRDDWPGIWESRVRQPQVATPTALIPVTGIAPGPIPTGDALHLARDLRPGAQPGGETQAHTTLDEFLFVRGGNYHRSLSSPLMAITGCSRLSPYLTWGNLSVRQVVHATRERLAAVAVLPDAARAELGGEWLRALGAFADRLRWRCHFNQKFEDQPDLEYVNMVRVYDGLREAAFREDTFAAWRDGMTGYPMIDASMRALHDSGWINFRMRAMLVSFAAYQLWLHWREPAVYLARVFLDYEPGIHYCQHQMQSGTTGINTLRIYNPVKQARDQDRDGVFVRRWLPELAGVPDSFIHAPWLMPGLMQQMMGCVIGRDYPAPIVNHEVAARAARERIWAVRQSPEAQEEADAVRERHGSRAQVYRPRRSGARSVPTAANQLRLDL